MVPAPRGSEGWMRAALLGPGCGDGWVVAVTVTFLIVTLSAVVATLPGTEPLLSSLLGAGPQCSGPLQSLLDPEREGGGGPM